MKNKNPMTKYDGMLSTTAKKNLMKCFSEDYDALIKLYCWGKISPEVLMKAIS